MQQQIPEKTTAVVDDSVEKKTDILSDDKSHYMQSLYKVLIEIAIDIQKYIVSKRKETTNPIKIQLAKQYVDAIHYHIKYISTHSHSENVYYIYHNILPFLKTKVPSEYVRVSKIFQKRSTTVSHIECDFFNSFKQENRTLDFLNIINSTNFFSRSEFTVLSEQGDLHQSKLKKCYYFSDCLLTRLAEGYADDSSRIKAVFSDSYFKDTDSKRLSVRTVAGDADVRRQRQKYSGECFLASTIQSMRSLNPSLINNMLYTDKDGTIVAKVFLTVHGCLLEHFIRFDPTDFQAEIFGIRKQDYYHSNKSKTVSFLIKLYAISKMYEDILNNRQPKKAIDYINNGGNSDDVLQTFTGKIPLQISTSSRKIYQDFEHQYLDEFSKEIFKKTDCRFNSSDIYQLLTLFLNMLTKLQQNHSVKPLNLVNLMAKDFNEFKKSQIYRSMMNEPKNEYIEEFFEFFKTEDGSKLYKDDAGFQNMMFNDIPNLSEIALKPTEYHISEKQFSFECQFPPSLQFIKDKLKDFKYPKYINLVEKQNEFDREFQPSKQVLSCDNQLTMDIFSVVKKHINQHDIVTASTLDQFQGVAASQLTGKSESTYQGIVSNHCYSVLGYKVRCDSSGKLWPFVVIQNPWGYFHPLYNKNPNGCVERGEIGNFYNMSNYASHQQSHFGEIVDQGGNVDDKSCECLISDVCGFFEHISVLESTLRQKASLIPQRLSQLEKKISDFYQSQMRHTSDHYKSKYTIILAQLNSLKAVIGLKVESPNDILSYLKNILPILTDCIENLAALGVRSVLFQKINEASKHVLDDQANADYYDVLLLAIEDLMKQLSENPQTLLTIEQQSPIQDMCTENLPNTMVSCEA